ncbi:MAG: NAD(P)-dependent oxidoreductase [Spirochaetaceae bacterium]|jgi:nucleoside-diphosphate-sugar epimerase|nr:NAD(P)-dependent oxidoreductase [Spirochaetaceae bacterium]
MGKKVLVTGSSGMLGNFVCPYLKEQGYKVAGFDVMSAGPDSANTKAGIPFVQGNLSSLGDCLKAIAFAQPDVIVHLGAVRFNTELQPPFAKEYNIKHTDGARFIHRLPEDAAMEINTMGTYYLMDAARRLGVKKVVAASSYFVLGLGFRLSGTSYQPEYLPMDENHPLLPEDTYSLSKVLGEEIYKAFVRAYDMRVVAMRFLGVYYHDNEVSRKQNQFGITVPAATPEDQGYLISGTYQYVDARDAAVFTRLSIEADNLAPFEPFFVATDTTYTEPTAVIAARRWPFLAHMAKDIPGTEGLISTKKAETLLGFKSLYTWRNQK